MPDAVEHCLLRPRWQLPMGVHAAMTTRQGGTSTGPWRGWNMGRLCGDSPAPVAVNRSLLQHGLGLKAGIRYLHQVHGADIMQRRAADSAWQEPRADGHWTRDAGLALAVLAADCLPVLMTANNGSMVGAAHAGWRGLASGVLAAQVREMRAHLPAGERIVAWVGIGIGPCHYEVDSRVVNAIVAATGPAAWTCIHDVGGGHATLDLAGIAAIQLHELSVSVTMQGGCTACDERRWYSHRRDSQSGRMAALIWREPLLP